MGIAAYNRGTKRVADEITRRIEASRATNEARALLWRDALDAGAILSFRAAGGAIVTVGPNRTAIPTRDRFSAYRDEGDKRWRGSHFFTSSWACALWILENVGRARPYKVVC